MKARMRIRKVLLGCFVFIIITELRVFDGIVSGVANRIVHNNFDLETFDGNDAINTAKLHEGKRETGKVPALIRMSSCPEYPPNLIGKVPLYVETSTPPTFNDISKANPKINDGGHYSPIDCIPHYKVAIIIAFREREVQLRLLLAHMHPVWQRQEIDYKVYVINQAGNELFNKGKLFNSGVVEAEKDGPFDCYVFQDVDLLLEDDRCLYWCHNGNPRHLSMYVDTFSYRPMSYPALCPPLSVPYHMRINLFGGVTMLSLKHFVKVNGYSNTYWGWGGEDDDFFLRLWNKGYKTENPYGKQCSFRMIKHEHESKNVKNPGRKALLFHSIDRMDMEGYKTLRYRILSTKKYHLYTNITVDVGQPSQKMKDFMSQNFNWLTECLVKMPWNM